MPGTLDDALGRTCRAWVAGVARRPGRVVAAALLVTLAVGAAGLPRLGLDSNEDILFSEDLPFVPRRERWRELFPRFRDPIVVLVEGETPDAAHAAAVALAERARADDEHFGAVDRVGGGRFFERNGLLYLDVEELAELSDRLASVQPFLAELARDPSLRGLLPLLGDAIEAAADDDFGEADLAGALERVADVVAVHARGGDTSLAWSEWIRGEASLAGGVRRILLVQPVYDFSQVNPAEDSIDALRRLVAELGLDREEARPARARLTGVYVLVQEESHYVTRQSTWVGAASFVLVAIVLGVGLRSLRTVLAALGTLVAGLVVTAGLAAFTIGRLNLISVSFAVLFIGLSIDFAIHLVVRFQELVRGGAGREEALAGSAGDVGGSLVICATTTAIGFFSFAPTDYRGVAELGIIAGTGMFVSLVANLTLLPALLCLGRRPPNVPRVRVGRLGRLTRLPIRYRGAVLAAMAAACVLAAVAIPHVTFDVNPLRMRDPRAPAVSTFNDLLERGEAVIWNLSATAPDPEAAAALAERLEARPSVEEALTLVDFVPDDQGEKLAIVDDLAFLLGPGLAEIGRRPPPTAAERRAAVAALRDRLAAVAPRALPAAIAAPAARLEAALGALLEGGAPDPALARLDRALTGTLPEQLRLLRTALDAGPVALESLSPAILDSWIATDGSVRIEVFPAEDLGDNAALARYVDDVLELAPGAYGEGYTIYQAGRAVVRSLEQALRIAVVAILLLLLVLWRRPVHAGLVMAPLLAAALLTAGLTVALSLPLNFANVIVIPLLLGMGVDSGIHLVHRLRGGGLPGGNLLRTSTARGVLLSALTTAASFGTLGASTHPSLASLGRLLALGLLLILVCNLVLLPALAARRR